MPDEIAYRLNPPLSNLELNALFSTGWAAWQTAPDASDWQAVLTHSLVYIGAFVGESLVGFVNVAWDGRDHAFLLDPRLEPEFRHRGIGSELVRRAAEESRAAGCEWLHVDYEPELAPFYEACGFKSSAAGVMRLR
ncbi:MAG TPA: GNAT family N-acetyltransferase [Dehalococcoidia bacterium]|nr:GNAT family N-acetyltransferase [Dehalococcoidia bacterium]